jgi:hypothetical protein
LKWGKGEGGHNNEMKIGIEDGKENKRETEEGD